MAVQARYTEQIPFVGTVTQREIVEAESERRGISKAAVIREAFDRQHGLVNGERVAVNGGPETVGPQA